MSRIIECSAIDPNEETIAEVIAVLTNAGVVVMPTETQYSLSIRADVPSAFDEICRIKRRSNRLSLAVFVKDIEMAEKFCEINPIAKKLAKAFLPGPMTLIVPVKKNQNRISPRFISQYGVGLRISSSPFVAEVISRVDFPVTATSANISGQVVPETIAEISKQLGDEVALYIDAGPCNDQMPSTVVSVSDSLEILRSGSIAREKIMSFAREGDS